MASFALRRACHERNRHYTMISSNRAKSVVAGYSKANKARVRNCIRERFPHLKDLRLNEHEYDAYAIALTFIHDPANQINNP
jgi:Holliday junction resolvasome RuvABC endonuclease subunit